MDTYYMNIHKHDLGYLISSFTLQTTQWFELLASKCFTGDGWVHSPKRPSHVAAASGSQTNENEAAIQNLFLYHDWRPGDGQTRSFQLTVWHSWYSLPDIRPHTFTKHIFSMKSVQESASQIHRLLAKSDVGHCSGNNASPIRFKLHISYMYIHNYLCIWPHIYLL